MRIQRLNDNANGVPAPAECQSTGLWHNETITGVPVTLTAIGSDGTVIDIGTTTTNGYYGTFGKAWTPPKKDTYTIIATFAGDDSYGSSGAATAVTVGPAPATPTPVVTAAPINAATTNDLMTYMVARRNRYNHCNSLSNSTDPQETLKTQQQKSTSFSFFSF